MAPGPELLIILLGFLGAATVAAVGGSLVGRRVQRWLERRLEVHTPEPWESDAPSAAIDPPPPDRPPGTDAPAPGRVGSVGASIPPADPDGLRRLAGLPPVVASRVPSAQSPAMRDRGGVPFNAGPLPASDGELREPPWAARPVDRRVAAAPFVLDARPPRASGPAAPSHPAAPSGLPREPGPVPVPAPGPALGPASRGPLRPGADDARRRRASLIASAAAAIGLVGLLLLTGVIGGPRGEVLQATGKPVATASPSPAGD